jgi:hypothetical protein
VRGLNQENHRFTVRIHHGLFPATKKPLLGTDRPASTSTEGEHPVKVPSSLRFGLTDKSTKKCHSIFGALRDPLSPLNLRRGAAAEFNRFFGDMCPAIGIRVVRLFLI